MFSYYKTPIFICFFKLVIAFIFIKTQSCDSKGALSVHLLYIVYSLSKISNEREEQRIEPKKLQHIKPKQRKV